MNYESLINRIKQHDNSAIMEFYNKFYKEVYYVCYRITENEKDAEDIAQETLIKAIDKIDTLKNPEGLSSWMKAIANNLSINYLKKNRKFNIVENSEDMGEEILEENRIAAKTPEDIVADKEVADILTNMINELPREQRITIFLFYYEELSVKEIAEIMDCSEATVRSRINYARKALRKQVDELENKGVKLRCITILPFLFTIYNFEKAGLCARVVMPGVDGLNAGMKGEDTKLNKLEKVTEEVVKMSVKAKIAVGTVATILVIGGIIGTVKYTENKKETEAKDSFQVLEESKVDALEEESQVAMSEGNQNNKQETMEVNECKYKMLVNGVEHNFPMTYEEFIGLGWDVMANCRYTAIEIGENSTLAADCVGPVEEYSTVGTEGIWLQCYNPTENDLAIKDCNAIGMSYDERLIEYSSLDAGVIEFTDGTSTISIGVSTVDDVKNAFGEPKYTIYDEAHENTEYVKVYMYQSDEGDWLLHITFDENGVSKFFAYRGEY